MKGKKEKRVSSTSRVERFLQRRCLYLQSKLCTLYIHQYFGQAKFYFINRHVLNSQTRPTHLPCARSNKEKTWIINWIGTKVVLSVVHCSNLNKSTGWTSKATSMFKVIGQNLIEFAYLYLSLSIECISIQARQASIQQWKLAAPLMIDRSSSEHVYKLQFLRLNVPSCRWPCNFLETQAASELVLTCYIIESVINLFGPKWEGRSYNKHHMDKQARTSRSRTLLLPTI